MRAKKQPRRVAAWIYAVINPIIASLEREISLLDSGNLTWRAYTLRCEMIKTVQEYVDAAQWPNYQDFLAEHPKSAFVPAFKRHDSNVDALNNAARALFSRLPSWPAFADSVRTALESYEARRASLGPQATAIADMGRGLNEEIAQHLINNSQILPSHYVISSFWNSEGGARLASLRNSPEFRPVQQATEHLLEQSAKLKQALEAYRLSLSREYDVPAAPVPGAAFEQ